MIIQPFSFASLKQALAEGWRIANATRLVSIAYSLIFVLGGVLIIGGLLAQAASKAKHPHRARRGVVCKT